MITYLVCQMGRNNTEKSRYLKMVGNMVPSWL